MAKRCFLREPRPEICWSAASDFDWFTSRSLYICVAQTCHCVKRIKPDGLHVFFYQECWSHLTSCYFHLFHKEADVEISRLAFKARAAWTVPNWWQTPRRCYHFPLEKRYTAGVGYHGCGSSCTQSPESRLHMQHGNNRHRGWYT